MGFLLVTLPGRNEPLTTMKNHGSSWFSMVVGPWSTMFNHRYGNWPPSPTMADQTMVEHGRPWSTMAKIDHGQPCS